MNPLCTIIVPNFNCEEYLAAMLASVSAQHLPDLEIIIVDDGSTDNSLKIITELTTETTPIKVIQCCHVGPSAARNAAIKLAGAPLVAFLDADDVWSKDKLARQISFHQAHPEVVFSFTDYLHVDPQGRSLGTCFEYWKPKFLQESSGFQLVPQAQNEILACNIVGTSTAVVRTEALRQIGGFRDDLRSAEDWDLWLRLAALGPVACSPRVGTLYLVRPDSVSRDQSRRIDAKQTILNNYRGGATPERRKAVRRAQALISIARAENARAMRAFWSAAAYHLAALAVLPSFRLIRAFGSDVAQGFGLGPKSQKPLISGGA